MIHELLLNPSLLASIHQFDRSIPVSSQSFDGRSISRLLRRVDLKYPWTFLLCFDIIRTPLRESTQALARLQNYRFENR